ncbi:MAG: mycofactocin system FadH/OYE family oxidoreductase 2 [Thermodesulfobacteriota bacterium]
MAEFKHLFSPLKIGAAVVANRVSFSAHMTNFGEDHRISGRHVDYYRERARGGAGLIVTEELSVHPSDHPYEKLVFAFDPGVIPGYRRLTEAIHRYETKIFAQLNHNGQQGDGSHTRLPLWGPSPVPDPLFRECPKEMEVEDILECIEYFTRSAEYAREGGFDGIEIQIGHSSLIRQFLSPLTNQRQDKYGGDFDGRLRFALEVLTAVRRAVGPDYTVGVRLNADEMHPLGGLSIADTPRIARALEDSRLIDFLDLSLGTFFNLYLVEGSMHTPLAYTVPLAAAIRSQVTLPVFATNRINDPHLAEKILADGHADMIGMVRALICDPELVNKAREGRSGDIRHCIACNQGCIGRMGLGLTLSCVQNPAVGREAELGEGTLAPAARPKKVVVAGAGPAGLEAARVLALRGHEVILLEKAGRVGGQNILAALAPGRQEIEGVTRWLSGQVRRLPRVELRLNTEATAVNVLALKPDAVVVATGARPRARPFGGEYGPPGVLTTWQVLGREFEVKNTRVLLVDQDGHHHAVSTAEFLAREGNEVHVVTPALFVGGGLGPLQDLALSRRRLAAKGVGVITDVAVFALNGTVAQGVQVYTGEMVNLEGYDVVVLACGSEAHDDLYHQLKGKVAELYRIGDAAAPRKLDMAVLEGRRVGLTI